MTDPQNMVFRGRSISAGIGIGPASVLPEYQFEMENVKTIPGETDKEIERFYRALEKTRQSTHELIEHVSNTLFEQMGELFSVQELVLKDPTFTSRVTRAIEEENLCAESAVIAALRELNKEFVDRTKGGALESRSVDFLDVGMRILQHMETSVSHPQLPQGGILIAHQIAPSLAIRLGEYSIDGLITANTDRSSHTAIVAQALELPAIGLRGEEFYDIVEPGDEIIVGANQNQVIVNPSDKKVKIYKKAREHFFSFTRNIRKKTQDLTPEELPITIRGNLGLLSEVSLLKRQGGAGAGLVRTEFLFMGQADEIPDEVLQTETYHQLCHFMEPDPVTIRTFDMGGDKTTYRESEEVGGRGVYRTLYNREAMHDQLKALMHVYQEHDNLRVMLPLVGSDAEIKVVRKMMEELAEENKWEIPPLGIMVEVPSVLFQLEEIMDIVDFLSLGTNDLLNYLVGCDRFANEEADSVDFPDPVLFRFIDRVIQAVGERDIPVGICGEIAANPIYTPVLMGLGLSELSLAPMRMPEVKLVASRCKKEKAKKFAKKALEFTDRHNLALWVSDELGPYVQQILHENEIPPESRRFDYYEYKDDNTEV
jgi:phosphotransferase system enzyme I (PtsI)